MTNIAITLTKTEADDLNAFFEFQLDKEANHLAAFTSKDPNNKTAYMEKYTKLVSDPGINMQTIRVKDEIAGSISKFVMEGEAEITYWFDRKFWGQGIATRALTLFLEVVTARPLFTHVAKHNLGSRRVLEKNGFVVIGADQTPPDADGNQVEEFILKLD